MRDTRPSLNSRLSVIDEMFLRTHRGVGFPVALQGLWRTDDVVDAAELAAVHSRLAAGRLARCVVEPRMPGARPRWSPSAATYPVDICAHPIDDLHAWADHRADVDLDPTSGPGWALSAARFRSGTVVSLVCSHTLTDARGLIDAAGIAFSEPDPFGEADTFEFPTRTTDIADAIGLTGTVLYRSLRASAGLARSQNRQQLRQFTRRVEAPAVTATGEPSSIIVDIDADAWDAVASGKGGSVNSLFVAVSVGVARRCGVTQADPSTDTLDVDIPFGTGSGDANAIGMATVSVAQADSLGDIRSACKAAFGRPVGAPAGFPAEIVQLVPRSTAAKLTSTPGRGQILCSNIGAIPAALNHLGPHRAAGLSTRAIHPHAAGRVTTTRMSSYISSMAGRYTLSLVAIDTPRDVLADAVRGELSRWDLTAASW